MKTKIDPRTEALRCLERAESRLQTARDAATEQERNYWHARAMEWRSSARAWQQMERHERMIEEMGVAL